MVLKVACTLDENLRATESNGKEKGAFILPKLSEYLMSFGEIVG
jgi:hypothetical protein